MVGVEEYRIELSRHKATVSSPLLMTITISLWILYFWKENKLCAAFAKPGKPTLTAFYCSFGLGTILAVLTGLGIFYFGHAAPGLR